MKILLVSLLRIGDVFMIAPVIRRLKQLHGDADIDILINDEFAYILEVLPDISSVLLFPRREIQQLTSVAEASLLEPVQVVKDVTDQINSRGYDKVINLTHNNLSAHLMAVIDCPNKVGISREFKLSRQIEPDWFSYLNNRFYFEEKPPFHFSDLYFKGSGCNGIADQSPLSPSAEDREWASQFDLRSTILFQLTTSDEKKSWPLGSAQKVIESLTAKGHSASILCAPGEESEMRRLWEGRAQIFACRFSQALALMERAAALVTVDTSIKHLANATKIQVIELALGSSNPFETGARSGSSYIIKSMEPCVPCHHSANCHRSYHACGSSVDAEWFSHVVDSVVGKDWDRVSQLAKMAHPGAQLLKTTYDDLGMWSALPCYSLPVWRKEFAFLMRRSAYQGLLLGEGDHGRWVRHQWFRMTSEVSFEERQKFLLETRCDRLAVKDVSESILRRFRVGPLFPPTLTREEQQSQFLSAAREFTDFEYGKAYHDTFLSCLEGGAFVALKKVREYMRETAQMMDWEISIIDEILNREEMNVYRVGTLHEKSPREASRGAGKN